jgi:segregation and condensation protein B
LSVDKYSGIIESILFYENDIVKVDKLIKVTGLPKRKVIEIINKLIEEYDKEIHGLKIIELADGYTFQTKKEIFPFIREFYNLKLQNKLTKTLLTVLSIIAYKQPITKGEIESIRGVNSDNPVKRLIELDYIQILGRKEVLGKPLIYGTTATFLKDFNLKSIKDLPKVGEIKGEEFSLEE